MKVTAALALGPIATDPEADQSPGECDDRTGDRAADLDGHDGGGQQHGHLAGRG